MDIQEQLDQEFRENLLQQSLSKIKKSFAISACIDLCLLLLFFYYVIVLDPPLKFNIQGISLLFICSQGPAIRFQSIFFLFLLVTDTHSEEKRKMLKSLVKASYFMNHVLVISLVVFAASLFAAPQFGWVVKNRLVLGYGSLIYTPVGCFLLFLSFKAKKELKTILEAREAEDGESGGDLCSEEPLNSSIHQ